MTDERGHITPYCNVASSELYNLRWDNNGNLAQQTVYSVANNTTNYQTMRMLFWDEDDRLNLVAGDGYLSYYAYGHDGNRAIKMTGNAAIDQTGTLLNSTNLENITIYPSEYLTVTQAEYTKYYYAGGNRIASKIGTGGFGKMQRLCTEDLNISGNANTLFGSVLLQVTNPANQANDEYPVDVCGGYSVAAELIADPLPDFYISQTNLNFTQNNLLQQFRQNLTNSVEPVYYFHSDHLGSASWITNNTGLPVQHLLYLPFGEHFVNERSAAYDERFTFTGKERDAETGYYYHGARFNSSDIGWLSVDPMADKYPSMSPYAYCAWNPVKLVDPTGKEFDPVTETKYIKVYENEINARIQDIDKKRGTDEWDDKFDAQYEEYNNILLELNKLREDEKNIYTVRTGVRLGGDDGRFSYGYVLPNKKRQMFVEIAENKRNVCLIMGYLAHELKHAYQYYNRELGFLLKNGVQDDSSDSKDLERQATVRGNMFSGNTLLNNGFINYNINLNWQSYKLNERYDDYPDVTNVDGYARYYGENFIYNEK